MSAREQLADPVRYARISAAPLSVDTLLRAVSHPQVGGIGLFVGVVRNRDGGSDVTSLDYSNHPSAQAALAAAADRVARRHPVLAVAVEHRIGHLEVGDLAVVVAAGAAHRGPALAACAELIDDLKATVPIWKEQHFADGRCEWVGLA